MMVSHLDVTPVKEVGAHKPHDELKPKRQSQANRIYNSGSNRNKLIVIREVWLQLIVAWEIARDCYHYDEGRVYPKRSIEIRFFLVHVEELLIERDETREQSHADVIRGHVKVLREELYGKTGEATLEYVFLAWTATTTHSILWMILLLLLRRLGASAADVSTFDEICLIDLLLLVVGFFCDLRLAVGQVLHLDVDVADLDTVEFI